MFLLQIRIWRIRKKERTSTNLNRSGHNLYSIWCIMVTFFPHTGHVFLSNRMHWHVCDARKGCLCMLACTVTKLHQYQPTPEYVKQKELYQKPQHLHQNLHLHKQNPKALCQKVSHQNQHLNQNLQRRKTLQTNMAQALEKAYENWPMTSTADYKAKTPGYTPAPNRYFARQHGVVGKTTTKDWNIQKKAVTGYTAASDQYFATKQRLAYHPADKTFNGYGLKANGSAQQAPLFQFQPVETKPAPNAPAKSKGTMPNQLFTLLNLYSRFSCNSCTSQDLVLVRLQKRQLQGLL